jgi:hypothetical protein
MPPLPVIPNVIRCAVSGSLPSGRQWVNVYHLLKPGGMSVATFIATVDPLLVALYSTPHGGTGQTILGACKTTLTLSQIAFLPLDGTSATVTVSHGLTGLDAGDSLPAQTALVVTSQTGLRGRQHRGRVFLPPMVESHNQPDGAVQPSLVSGLQTQFNGYLADATVATVFPVVASYKHVSEALITDYVVRSKWATRRKRQGRQI